MLKKAGSIIVLSIAFIVIISITAISVIYKISTDDYAKDDIGSSRQMIDCASKDSFIHLDRTIIYSEYYSRNMIIRGICSTDNKNFIVTITFINVPDTNTYFLSKIHVRSLSGFEEYTRYFVSKEVYVQKGTNYKQQSQ